MHVMLDLETLGTKPGCTILSIGAVAFDPEGGVFVDEAFYIEISRASCRSAYFFEDPSTMKWWSTHVGTEAYKILSYERQTKAVSIGFALTEFASWLQGISGPLSIWSNGVSFDLPILAEAYRHMGLMVPWGYESERCFRTLKSLRPEIKTDRKGEYHNARDDAINQALHALTIL